MRIRPFFRCAEFRMIPSSLINAMQREQAQVRAGRIDGQEGTSLKLRLHEFQRRDDLEADLSRARNLEAKKLV
jgi:hypothetical protein